MRTTTTCAKCGKEIPEAVIGDAYCVKCRYSDPPRSKPWNTPGKDGERDGFKIEREKESASQKRANSELRSGGMAIHNGKSMHPDPSYDFDFDSIEESNEVDGQLAKVSLETMRRLLQMVISDSPNPNLIGWRTIFFYHVISGEQTGRQLADRYGVTAGRVSQLLKPFRAEIDAFLRENSAPS